jgi:hypothetical protein
LPVADNASIILSSLRIGVKIKNFENWRDRVLRVTFRALRQTRG